MCQDSNATNNRFKHGSSLHGISKMRFTLVFACAGILVDPYGWNMQIRDLAGFKWYARRLGKRPCQYQRPKVWDKWYKVPHSLHFPKPKKKTTSRTEITIILRNVSIFELPSGDSEIDIDLKHSPSIKKKRFTLYTVSESATNPNY